MMALKRTLQGGKVMFGAGPEGDATMCKLADHTVTSGATAISCILAGNRLTVANAGDSRGVLCRQGEAVSLSYDHKPIHEIERERIVRGGGFITEANGHHRVNGNLNLSRSLGDLKYKQGAQPWSGQIITAEPDIIELTLHQGDEFFALACDGVWDVMTNAELVAFVRAQLSRSPKPSLSQVCEAVLDFCCCEDPKSPDSKGVGTDNMTMVLVDLGQMVH